MRCSQCQGIEEHFDPKVAEGDLERYRHKGPSNTTRRLINGIVGLGIENATLLDIGGGIGAIQLELLKRGLGEAIGAEASSAYAEFARQAATDAGLVDKTRQITGDFVELAPEIPQVDIVTLDRVICCYHDWDQLVRLSTAKARRVYAAAYPRDGWWVRALLWFENVIHRARGTSFRTYAHPVGRIHELINDAGFEAVSVEKTLVWRVEIYRR